MSITVVESAALATSLSFSADEMTVELADGRRLSVPLTWFPRLAKATPAQLSNYELMGDGEGIQLA